MKISILDCTGLSYTAKDSDTRPLGGIERCVNALAVELAQCGHDVVVHNGVPEKITDAGVIYAPLRRGYTQESHVVIACNSADLFDDYQKISGCAAFKPVLWIHNPVSLTRTVRKGRFGALLRHRPVGVFLGEDHLRTTSRLLPLSKRVVIEHGVEDGILSYPSDENAPPRQKIANYISLPYRGLKEVMSVWKDAIHPALPDAVLNVYADVTLTEDDNKAGIYARGRVPRAVLTEALSSGRLTFIPGLHANETFCLSAAESLCLGAPVLTYGYGALKERVAHDKTGYIAKNEKDFADAAYRILTDDAYWMGLHAGALQMRKTLSWKNAAGKWNRFLEKISNE